MSALETKASLGMVPMVIEQSGRGERVLRHLLRACCKRAHRLPGGRGQRCQTANLVVAQLLFLESENPDKEISLYINSPGGSVSRRDVDLRHDAVHQAVGLDAVHRLGRVSMGAFLLAAGEKGKRFALPNSKIMIHQVLGGAQRSGHRHRDPRPRDPQDPRADEPHPGRTHRAERWKRSRRTPSVTIS